MDSAARCFIAVAWLIFLAIWLLGALTTKRSVRVETPVSRLSHVLPIAVAVYLVATPRIALPYLSANVYARGPLADIAGVSLTALGLGFAIWARLYLGRNWSALVAVKENHELITSGPYAVTRHPIYTGLLTAVLGVALMRADIRGFVALVMVAVALWRKLKLEERWMTETFGARYEAYKARVAALLPYVL
jgi:protein-S-isoprenylcysteine O-methyltransferase Ste14